MNIKIKDRIEDTANCIIEIGRSLIDIKGCLPQDEFDKWVEAEFGMSADTADKLMKVVSTQDKLSIINNFLV